MAVQRDAGRHRLRWFGLVGGVVALVGALVAVAFSGALDVDRIEVTGVVRGEVAPIVATSGIESGDPLVAVDGSDVEDAVGGLPWVDEVAVSRSWFGTVGIDIVERVPVVGFVGPAGEVALVDRSGRILEVSPLEERRDEGPGLLFVDGAQPPGAPGSEIPDVSRPALAVAAALPPDVTARIAQLEIAAGGDLRLVLRVPEGEEPGVVLLGNTTSLDAKVASLATMLTRVDLTGLATIDLRVPSSPALTRR